MDKLKCGLHVISFFLSDHMKNAGKCYIPIISRPLHSIVYHMYSCVLCRHYLLRDVYDDMMLDGVKPERDTFHSLIVGTMKGARLQDAFFFHNEMKAMGLVPDVCTRSCFLIPWYMLLLSNIHFFDFIILIKHEGEDNCFVVLRCC